MILYLRLAWRNLWRHKRRTLIVVIAIAFTLSLMMFYDGMVAGFEEAIYGNAIKVMGGHVQIHAAGYSDQEAEHPILPMTDSQAVVAAVEGQPGVVSVSRRIITGGLASNREGAFGLQIVAIEPDKESQVSLVAQKVSAGRYLESTDQDVVLIGKGLADAMEVNVGDRMTLVGGSVHEQTRRRTMTVVGIYDLNMADVEKMSVYITLGEAQDLYGLPGQATEVMVTLKQLGDEKDFIQALEPKLSGYEIQSWQTSFPELESALTTKTKFMGMFSVIMLVIAGIGIMNLLLMAVFERTREIGVLAALGLKPGQVSWLFLLEGAMMGLVGLAAGIALGLTINGIFGVVGMDYSQFSSMTTYTALINERIYTSLGVEKLPERGITTLVIAILSALYPAHEAAQKEPATALHYV